MLPFSYYRRILLVKDEKIKCNCQLEEHTTKIVATTQTAAYIYAFATLQFSSSLPF